MSGLRLSKSWRSFEVSFIHISEVNKGKKFLNCGGENDMKMFWWNAKVGKFQVYLKKTQ